MPRNCGSSVVPWHSTIYCSEKRPYNHLTHDKCACKLLVKHNACMGNVWAFVFTPGGTSWGCCASQPRPRCLWSWWRTSCRRRCGSEHHYDPELHWRGARYGSKSSANTHRKEEDVLSYIIHTKTDVTERDFNTFINTEVRSQHHHTELEMNGNLKQKSWNRWVFLC